MTDGWAAFADGSRLLNGTQDFRTPVRLLRELNRLQKETAAPLAAFLAAVPSASTAFANSLIPLAAGFPNSEFLQGDIQTAQAHASAAVPTIQADAATAQNDVSTLIGDLTSMLSP